MAPGIGIGISPSLRRGGGVSWSSYWTQRSLFFLDGTIITVGENKYFEDKSAADRHFLITGYDFDTTWTSGFPYKSAATISAPAADAALIAADVNNFLYAADETPNQIPVVSLFQDIDYEHKIFCKHAAQVLDGNGVETFEPRVSHIFMATDVLSGDDLTKAYTDFGVTAETTGNDVRWVMPTGSDLSATGYKAAPWLTVSKAISAVNDADIVYVKTDDEAVVAYDTYNNKIIAIGYRKHTIANTTYSLRFSASGGNEWMGIVHVCGTASYSILSANPILKFNRNHITGLDNALFLGQLAEMKNNILLHGAAAGSKAINFNAGTGTPVVSGNLIKATKATSTTTVFSIEAAYGDFTISHNKFMPNTTVDIINNSGSTDDVLVIDNVILPTAFRFFFAATGERKVTVNYNRFIGTQMGTGVVLTTCKIIVNEIKYNVATIKSLVNNTNSSAHVEGNIINSFSVVETSGANIRNYVTADGAITACRALYNRIKTNRTGDYVILVGSDGYSAAGRDVVAEIKIIGNRIINTNTTGCHTITIGGQKNATVKFNNIEGSGGGIGILGKDHNCDDEVSFIGYNIIKNVTSPIYVFATVATDGVRIFNNLVISNVNNGYGIITRDIGSTGDPTNCIVRNNIVICTGTGNINMVSNEGAGNTYDYNLYYCPNGTALFGGGTFAAWQASGQDAHSKVLTAGEFAALFTDFANGDYSLPVGSAAIGAGENVGAAFDDGLDASTDWGSDTAVPVIVSKQQGTAWDCGPFVH